MPAPDPADPLPDHARRSPRRHPLLPLLLAALAFVLIAPNASAFRQWCRTDPIVRIDGQIAHVLVSVPREARDLTTGPIELVIAVPAGVDAELIAANMGFGYGYVVTFVPSDALATGPAGTAVEVSAVVPTLDGTIPVLVEFVPNGNGPLAAGAVRGLANAWVVLRSGQ